MIYPADQQRQNQPQHITNHVNPQIPYNLEPIENRSQTALKPPTPQPPLN